MNVDYWMGVCVGAVVTGIALDGLRGFIVTALSASLLLLLMLVANWLLRRLI